MKTQIFFLIAACALSLHARPINDALETGAASYLQQLFIFKQLKPDTKKVAVFCQLKNHGDLEQKLSRLQVQFGIEMIVYDVRSLPDVSKHFKAATDQKKVDAIWLFADKILRDNRSQNYLIKQALRSKTLLLSVDPAMVSKGATASIRSREKRAVLILNQKAAALLSIEVKPEWHNSMDIIFI